LRGADAVRSRHRGLNGPAASESTALTAGLSAMAKGNTVSCGGAYRSSAGRPTARNRGPRDRLDRKVRGLAGPSPSSVGKQSFQASWPHPGKKYVAMQLAARSPPVDVSVLKAGTHAAVLISGQAATTSSQNDSE